MRFFSVVGCVKNSWGSLLIKAQESRPTIVTRGFGDWQKLKINFCQHQMRHFSGKTGRKKREKKGKRKFSKHKWGKYSVKAHYFSGTQNFTHKTV